MSPITPESFCKGVKHPQYVIDHNNTTGDKRWLFNDSPLVQYGGGDCYTTEPTVIMSKFLSLLGQAENPIVMDLAGGTNARALRDLHNLRLVTRALVTNYQDLRDETTRKISWLDHIDGDLIVPETWHKIIRWCTTNTNAGFNAILHNPIGALRGLDPNYYVGMLDALVDMTTPGGVILTRVVRPATSDSDHMKERPGTTTLLDATGCHALILKNQV